MRDRPTARVLLFDPEGRILLVRGRMTGDKPSRWFTPGGGMEEGETVLEAAAREIREEAGIACADVGPVVWRRKGVGRLHTGELVNFQEHFVVARCDVADLTRAGWEPHEIELMDDMRWWSLAELAVTEELVMPERLAELIGDIAAGRYPDSPLWMADWNTD